MKEYIVIIVLCIGLFSCNTTPKNSPNSSSTVNLGDGVEYAEKSNKEMDKMEKDEMTIKSGSINEASNLEIPVKIEKIEKSDEAWKKELDDNEFYILRKEGTERAFTGDLLKENREGVFVCRGCQLPLFSSETKFKSGTGWPSFYEPIADNVITEHVDNAYGMTRTEVECARCGGHQGHVFSDGPKPTGLRYCINSASMDFVAN